MPGDEEAVRYGSESVSLPKRPQTCYVRTHASLHVLLTITIGFVYLLKHVVTHSAVPFADITFRIFTSFVVLPVSAFLPYATTPLITTIREYLTSGCIREKGRPTRGLEQVTEDRNAESER